MGTTSDPKEFARRINRWANHPVGVAARTSKGLQQTGLAIHLKEIARDTNGSMRLRNVGRGAQVGAKASITKTGAVEFKATGPLQIINNDTKSHFVGPSGLPKTVRGAKSGRATAKSRAGRAKALSTPWGPKRWANHPGTKEKRTWQRGQSKVVDGLDKTIGAAVAKESAKYR